MKKLTRAHKTKDEKRRLLLTKKNVKQETRIAKYGSDSVAVVAKDMNHRFIAAFMALVFAISCMVVGINFATKAEEETTISTANLTPNAVYSNDLYRSKALSVNSDGTYNLNIETYSTGAEVSQQVPTDFVLVLDQSGSMANNDMPTGGFSEAGNSWTINSIANSSTAYYYHDSESNEYYRVYAKRGYLYYQYAANQFYMDDLFNKYRHFHYFANKTVYQGSNGYYYYDETEGAWHLMYLHVNGTMIGGAQYKCYLFYYNNQGEQTYIYNNKSNKEYYTYRQVLYQRMTSFSDVFDHPLWKRYVGYNELCYKDGNGEEHTLVSTDYCNSSKVPVSTAGGSTLAAYNGTLYTANDNETRLQALNTSAKAFIDLVASQTNTKADGTVETVDHRISVVGFSSENTTYSTYNNTEVLSPDSIVTNGSSFSGYSLDGNRHDGPQYSDGISTTQYQNSLVSTATDAGATSLKTSIDYVTAYGGTQPQDGFAMAKQVLTNRTTTTYTKADGTTGNRNTCVIFFTDGRPGNYTYSDQYAVANEVVAAAKEVKDLGATVYSIGVFGESDGNPLTYSRYRINSSSSNRTYGGTTYYSYTNYQSDDGNEKYTTVLEEKSYDPDYVEVYEETYNSVTYADVLYRLWLKSTSGYPDQADDTIEDYMSTVSSEYPQATEFVNDEWIDDYLDSDSTPATTYQEMITASRGTQSDDKYYYLATNADALTKAFSSIFESVSSTTTSLTLDAEHSLVQDVLSDGFEKTDATTVTLATMKGSVQQDGSIGGWNNREDNPSEVSWAWDNKTLNVTGFDFSSNFISEAQSGKKLIITISNLIPTGTGNLIASNASTSGIYAVNNAEQTKTALGYLPEPSISRHSYTLDVGEANTNGVFTVSTELTGGTASLNDVILVKPDGTRLNYSSPQTFTSVGDEGVFYYENVPDGYSIKTSVTATDDSYIYTMYENNNTPNTSTLSTSTATDRTLDYEDSVLHITSVANSRDVTLNLTAENSPYVDTGYEFKVDVTLSGDLITNKLGTVNSENSGKATFAVDGSTLKATVTMTMKEDGTIDPVTIKVPDGATLTVAHSDYFYTTDPIKYTDTTVSEQTPYEPHAINTATDIYINDVVNDSIESGITDNNTHVSTIFFAAAGAVALAGGAWVGIQLKRRSDEELEQFIDNMNK